VQDRSSPTHGFPHKTNHYSHGYKQQLVISSSHPITGHMLKIAIIPCGADSV
jgi:hypothetical protein